MPVLCSARNQTQGLTYARQALYQLSYILQVGLVGQDQGAGRSSVIIKALQENLPLAFSSF